MKKPKKRAAGEEVLNVLSASPVSACFHRSVSRRGGGGGSNDDDGAAAASKPRSSIGTGWTAATAPRVEQPVTRTASVVFPAAAAAVV